MFKKEEYNMKKSEAVKEKIIDATIELLQGSTGRIEDITIRQIAEKTGIGIGLINYHFGTKENLIGICVQKIIGNVIVAFRPTIPNPSNEIEVLKEVAKQVMDFLLNNPEISRIPIMGDMVAPAIMDNTMKTVIGFLSSIKTDSRPQQEKLLLTYSMTLILQGMFLKKDISLEALHFDFNKKNERDEFINFMIERLYRK
jgi:AcrR family transcriptional regulator